MHSDQLNFNELHRVFGEIRFQGNILYIGSVYTQFEGHYYGTNTSFYHFTDSRPEKNTLWYIKKLWGQ